MATLGQQWKALEYKSIFKMLFWIFIYLKSSVWTFRIKPKSLFQNVSGLVSPAASQMADVPFTPKLQRAATFQPIAYRFSAGRWHLRSVRRKLLWSWKRGKLSHESTGWTCSAASMSARYRDRKVSACSAISSGHHEKACGRADDTLASRQ